MKKTLKVMTLAMIGMFVFMTTILAASGSYGPDKSLKWEDDVYTNWMGNKTTYIKAWDPKGRASIERKVKACFGGAANSQCTISGWQKGYSEAYAERSGWLAPTAYTYKYWR